MAAEFAGERRVVRAAPRNESYATLLQGVDESLLIELGEHYATRGRNNRQSHRASVEQHCELPELGAREVWRANADRRDGLAR